MPIYALAPPIVTSSTSSRICLRVGICGLPSNIYSSYTLDSYDSLFWLIPGLACMIRYLEYASCARKVQPLSPYFGRIQCVILVELVLVLWTVYIYSEMMIFRECKTRATWSLVTMKTTTQVWWRLISIESTYSIYHPGARQQTATTEKHWSKKRGKVDSKQPGWEPRCYTNETRGEAR